MSPFRAIRFSAVFFCMLVLAVLIVSQPVQAEQWRAIASAQSEDKGKQAGAYLPNELWIHVGDSITWTFAADWLHTVTFLKQDTTPQQIRPLGGGCPGTTPDSSSFDGSACVTSGALGDG